MRTIKFRGRDAVGGKGWVYGDLVHNKKVTRTGLEPRVMVGGYEVDEESIGQYTGMHDKNGKEIYEGDILRSPLGNIVAVEFGYKEHIVKHGRPYITDSFACYGWIARNVKNGITDFFDNEFAAGEVVGNIYDNPELIKKR